MGADRRSTRNGSWQLATGSGPGLAGGQDSCEARKTAATAKDGARRALARAAGRLRGEAPAAEALGEAPV
jgi:hypothetical protein